MSIKTTSGGELGIARNASSAELQVRPQRNPGDSSTKRARLRRISGLSSTMPTEMFMSALVYDFSFYAASPDWGRGLFAPAHLLIRERPEHAQRGTLCGCASKRKRCPHRLGALPHIAEPVPGGV